MILNDLLVLELSQVLAGPLCGMFCAELGARVIKIEPPKGDTTRNWRLPSETDSTSRPAYFCCCNWGKESIVLNLLSVEDRNLFHALVTRADIVTHSFRPGKAAALGADYEFLKSLNPGLIYLEISAYGSEDERPGYDAIIQAEAGFTYLNGEADGAPVKMPVALIDILLAHQAKQALLLALLKRERSGSGSKISLSLFDVALASLANQATNYLMTGKVPCRTGSDHPNIAPYGTIFYTGDSKPVVLAIGTDQQFHSLLKLIKADENVDDRRFNTNQNRVRNRHELHTLISEKLTSFTRDDFLKGCREENVPAGAVSAMDEVWSSSRSKTLVLDRAGLKGVRTFVADGITDSINLTEPPELGFHGERIREEFGNQR